MRQVLRFLLPLLAIAALATACGDDGDEVVAGDGGDASTSTTVDPDSAVSSPPLSDDGSAGPGVVTWARIEPTEDLVDPVVATPDEVIADPDDPNAVLVHFYGGVQACYGARAAAVETPDSVTITLDVGSQPDAADQACIEIAEAQELVVHLDAPLGDRELVANHDRG